MRAVFDKLGIPIPLSWGGSPRADDISALQVLTCSGHDTFTLFDPHEWIQEYNRGSRDGFVKQKITSVQLEGPSVGVIGDLPTL